MQVDSDPPPAPAVNDVPGQVDMTQMGRDTSVNPTVRIFWSWDAISAWTGKGQTGDACALFDTDDADANINYVICARVSNTNADPALTEILPASVNHPAYLFDCSNAKNDRCTQPTPRNYMAGQVLAGPLATTLALTQTGAGNLQNETDPFSASVANGPGEAYPHDTSLEIQVDSTLVPTGVRLANVCSYPSAGNGGNNNPFDCIVTPGIQYGTLRVTKTINNDNGGTKAFADFSFTAGSGSSTTGVITSRDAVELIDIAGSGRHLQRRRSRDSTGYTGYTTKPPIRTAPSVSVTAGNTTTCTINNNDNAPALHLRKTITNDNGGTAANTDWTLTATGTGQRRRTCQAATPVDSGATFKADTYTLSETRTPGLHARRLELRHCHACRPRRPSRSRSAATSPAPSTTTTTRRRSTCARPSPTTTAAAAANTAWTLTATGTGATPTNLSGSDAGRQRRDLQGRHLHAW